MRTTIERIQQNLERDKKNIEQYLYSQKLANLGRLVGDVTHKFNNILGGILGYSQLMQNDLPPDSNTYRQAQVIEKAAKRAVNLISQLNILATEQVYNKRLICPEELVKEVAAIVESTFNKNIKIEVKLSHNDEKIEADFSSMCQALLNLCLNARDAMPNGGSLIIQTKLAYQNGGTQKAEKKDALKKYVVFVVSDTGEGIEKKNLSLIFEPFFTTKKYGTGGGLGLTTAEGIIKEHQGKIKVHSQKRRGTTFEILLPAISEAPRHAKTKKIVEDERGQGELILLVDDEEDLRDMAKTIFERKGYKVLLAKDGQSALTMYKKYKKEIKLIILDMILPDLNSDQICHKIKTEDFNSKIIVTSGYTNHATVATVLKRGADSFIAKPWHVPEMLKETKRVLQSN